MHTGHLVIGDRVRQYLCEIEEDPTSLVENLYPRLDLEVFSDCGVEGVESGFAIPEKVGYVKHI